MSKRYVNGPFKGIVVARIINGVQHRETFSFRIKAEKGWRDATEAEKAALERAADAADARLAALQHKASTAFAYSPTSGHSNTGVRGISWRVGKDREGYPVEAFWLSLRHEGKQHSYYVRTTSMSWEEAWEKVVTRLGELKKLSRKEVRALKAAVPSTSIKDADTKKTQPTSNKRTKK